MADVRLTALNPEDSTTVPVACNAKGEILLEPVVGEYVLKAGDSMSGPLVMGEGHITLNINGSAEFAQDKIHFASDGSSWFSDGNLAFTRTGEALVGSTLSTAVGAPNTPGAVQVVRENNSAHLSIRRCSPDNFACYLTLAKSRGSTASPNAVQAIDQIGKIDFAAFDGNDWNERAASITANVDGVTDINQIPGNLCFFTSRGSGSGRLVERLRINSLGNLLIGDSDTAYPVNYILASGNAKFSGDVIVGSNGQNWIIKESGGLAHLIPTGGRESVGLGDGVALDPESHAAGCSAFVDGDGKPAPGPALRNIPAELTAVQAQLLKVLEKLGIEPDEAFARWDESA